MISGGLLNDCRVTGYDATRTAAVFLTGAISAVIT
jgi:hypothetical protein